MVRSTGPLYFDSGSESSKSRFMNYVDALSFALGRADRAAPLRAYCMGLLLPGQRKSVEPMAARVEPDHARAAHQSMHHFVANAQWSNNAVLKAVCAQVLPAVQQQDAIRAWSIDDLDIPKKGTQSVGVARQYCGRLGKHVNCQIAVMLSVANDHASLPISCRLYLPKCWANDPARRAKAGVPDDVAYRTRPAIALDQICAALSAGVPRGVVVADAEYGIDTAFRIGISKLGLRYVVGIQPWTRFWLPDAELPAPGDWSGRSQVRPHLLPRSGREPVPAKDLAKMLAENACMNVTWRDGTNKPLASHCAAVRVRPADYNHYWPPSRSEEWFIVEWLSDDIESAKYWLSTVPGSTPAFGQHVRLRWLIKRGRQALREEIGLGHYEGRGWRGFHHHATLCIAAYGFLLRESILSTIPPWEIDHADLSRPPDHVSEMAAARSTPSALRSDACSNGFLVSSVK